MSIRTYEGIVEASLAHNERERAMKTVADRNRALLDGATLINCDGVEVCYNSRGGLDYKYPKGAPESRGVALDSEQWRIKPADAPSCKYCDDTKQVEMDNNGPIGPCPVCCKPAEEPKRLEFFCIGKGRNIGAIYFDEDEAKAISGGDSRVIHHMVEHREGDPTPEEIERWKNALEIIAEFCTDELHCQLAWGALES